MSPYNFLCAEFDNTYFIYAIKSSDSDWYYFEEVDSVIDSHTSIRIKLEDQMRHVRPDERHSIAITVSSDLLETYVRNGKFIFNGIELKTFVELTREDTGQLAKSGGKNRCESSDDLVFVYGKTNPVISLDKFEICTDVKTAKDKLFKIRNFVNLCDRSEFSALFFKSDWTTARQVFLKKYSLAVTENKRKELSFCFQKEETLRSFVQRKMEAMSTFTTLSLQHQMEMILVDLPSAISNLFIIHDKMNRTKSEILEFCNTIEEYVDGMDGESSRTLTPTMNSEPEEQNVQQEVEVFEFDEELESSETTTSSRSVRSNGRSNSKLKGTRGLGRPRKVKEDVSTNSEFSGFDDSSCSAFSN